MDTEDDGTGFLRDILALHQRQSSGVLEVRHEGGLTLFYLKAGVAVFVEDGVGGDRLGKLLLQRGHLSESQYLTVLGHCTGALGAAEPTESEQQLFADAAVELGFLSTAKRDEVLAELVPGGLNRALHARVTERFFDEAPEALDEIAHFPCALPAVLMDGVRRFFDESRLLPILAPHLGTQVRLAASEASICEDLGLRPAEAKLLPALSGAFVGQALDVSVEGLGRLEQAAVLAMLVLTQNVVAIGRATAPPPPSEPPRGPSPSEQDARRRAAAMMRAEQLRKLARGRAEVIGPPSPGPAPRQVVRGVRHTQIERRRAFYAERHLRRAREALLESKWRRAQEELEQVAKHHKEPSEEWQLYDAYARYRLGGAPDDGLRALRARVASFLRSEGEHPVALYLGGLLTEVSGESRKAMRLFRRALDADANFHAAARRLRLLQMREK